MLQTALASSNISRKQAYIAARRLSNTRKILNMSFSNKGHNNPKDGWSNVIKAGTDFPPEKGRYHLYAVRPPRSDSAKLEAYLPFINSPYMLGFPNAPFTFFPLDLEDYVSLSIVHWNKGDPDPKTGKSPGWHFATPEEEEGCIPDPIYGAKYLSEFYFKADTNYEGVYSVPVLWDKKHETIVSNDSAQIMRMFSTCFDEIMPDGHPGKGCTYFPTEHQDEIEQLSPVIQDTLNGGVYKAGFAPDQETYDAAVDPIFETLDMLEKKSKATPGPFLLGHYLTELDAFHFKCNLTLIRFGFPSLHLWLRRLYWQIPAIYDTMNERHIKLNYYKSHKHINPTGIVPKGPKPFVEELKVDDFIKGSHLRATGVQE